MGSGKESTGTMRLQAATTAGAEKSKLLKSSFLRLLSFILLASLITTLAHNFGLMRVFEDAALDNWIKLKPLPVEDVVIVPIREADYQKLFGGQSPLDPSKLSELIAAILTGEPAVVVIDINTSDNRFADIKLPAHGAKVIWSREARELPGKQPGSAPGHEPVFAGDKVLGREATASGPLSGIALTLKDRDDIVRYYYRHLRVKQPNSTQIQFAPSVSWAAVQAYSGKENASVAGDCRKMVLFSAGGSRAFRQMAAGNLLSISSSPKGWKEMVKGKIVLLGGYYAQKGDLSQDSYVTASGTTQGVELIAEAIESELVLGGVSPAGNEFLFAWQLISGLLAAFLSHLFGRRWTSLTTILVIPVTTLAAGCISPSSQYLWVNLVPVLGAVLAATYLSDRRKPEQPAPVMPAGMLVDSTPDATVPSVGRAMSDSGSIADATAAPQRMKVVCLSCGREFDQDATVCPFDETTLSRIKSDDMTGKIFAERYEIISLLGQGGMSTVYKAQHRLLKSIVAIKVLRPHLEQDKESVMRFYQEAKATALLTHPNVVGATDFGITPEGRPFLVLSFVDGKSLKDLIAERDMLPEAEAVQLFLQICDGLACAHDQNVLHRDLKPANIMLVEHDKGLQVKIVDFGLAKIMSSDLKITSTGTVFGSPAYMSPEQCAGEKVDHRADIYALGCIMFECLSGHPPFEAGNVLEIFCLHANAAPPPLGDGVSAELSGIILTALAKDPADRFATVHVLKEKLENLPTVRQKNCLT